MVNKNNLNKCFVESSHQEQVLSRSSNSQLGSLDPAVLWISGFSAAGKTTVARKVKLSMQKYGINVVFFDGDDLRAIFGGKWSYERKDRIDLAHAYFRLCNSLVTQGVTVIISAVAMYNEIYTWVKQNVDRSLIAYLKVPEEERLERDKLTKNIYKNMGDVSLLYDEPTSPDIVIENYGSTSPEDAAQLIFDTYLSNISQPCSDKGRAEHWNEYYKSADLVFEPSSFAISISGELSAPVDLLEIGCGNGRDAAYFSKLGNNVVALDPSTEAICLCKNRYRDEKIIFVELNLPEYLESSLEKYDVVYSRFCFHAMTEHEELDNIKAAYDILRSNGQFYIECRSINDPLARKGEVISPTERIYGHYRRFIILDELEFRLKNAGFIIISKEERDNLAVLGVENPVVIRVCAAKP